MTYAKPGHTGLDHVGPHEKGLLHGYATLHGERVNVTDNTYVVGNPAGGAVSTMEDP